MGKKTKRSPKIFGAGLSLLILLVLAFGVPGANATLVTMTDVNSSATIQTDPYGIPPAGRMGMNSWVVGGTDLLWSQWFYLRPTDSTTALPLGDASVWSSASIVSSSPNSVDILYTALNGSLSVELKYSLTGGTAGSGKSDMGESIRIVNTGSASQTFSFFQYSDFDLGGTPDVPCSNGVCDFTHDVGVILNANTVRQAYAGSGAPGASVSETIATPAPTYYAIGLYPSLINSISAGQSLADNLGPVGPADVAWAYQWDDTLAPGGSLLISKDKEIGPVPEPGTLFLLGSGLIGAAGLGRLRRRK